MIQATARQRSAAMRLECGAARLAVDNSIHRPVYCLRNSGLLGSGSTRLGLSQKDGLPFRCWVSNSRFKAIDARLRGSPMGCSFPHENIPRPQSAKIAALLKSCGQFAERTGKKKTPAGLLAAGALWCAGWNV